MTNEIKKAIAVLAEKVNEYTDSGDALKYTQSALNLAHVLQVLAQIEGSVSR